MSQICPRCGNPGTPYRQKTANRHYIYYMHKDKTRTRRCYIGPMEGYVAAARLHEINIQHAFDIRHKLAILEELLEYFAEACNNPEDEEEKIVCERAKKSVEEFLRNSSK